MQLRDVDVTVTPGDLSGPDMEQIREAGVVAWDIETSGLDWRSEQIGTCQIHVPNTSVAIVKLDDSAPENLKSLLSDSSVKKIFHHAMFDLKFMSYHWDTLPRNVACTKIASKLLDPRQERKHSLKNLLDEYLSVKLSKEETTSNWLAPELTDRQLRYAANDVIFLLPLLRLLERQLESQKLLELALACFSHIPSRVQLELLGYDDVYTY